MVPAAFGLGQVFWSMLWFAVFVVLVVLLVAVLADVFRSTDLSGWQKALWTIFVLVLPFIGVFVYIGVRGGTMHDRGLFGHLDAQTRQNRF